MPLRRPITYDDLMTHRSGLAYRFSVGPPLNRAYGKLSFRQDQDRWLAELAALPLAHQPGERLTYSHATDVLGIALSRIEGKPLADVLSERVFEPLGMTDTGFAVGRTSGRRRAATMYTLDADNTCCATTRWDPPPVTRRRRSAWVGPGLVVDGRRLPHLHPHVARRRRRGRGADAVGGVGAGR